MDEFNDIIKDLRLENRKTQKEIADLLGIPSRTYSNYEQGKAEPDIKMIVKIASVYDVSCDYLLGRDDISETTSSEGAVLFDRLPSNIQPIAITYLETLLEVVRKNDDKK